MASGERANPPNFARANGNPLLKVQKILGTNVLKVSRPCIGSMVLLIRVSGSLRLSTQPTTTTTTTPSRQRRRPIPPSPFILTAFNLRPINDRRLIVRGPDSLFTTKTILTHPNSAPFAAVDARPPPSPPWPRRRGRESAGSVA